MSEQTDTTALELRRLTLEEKRIENERRATRTPEEAALDVAIREATTLADSPVLFYDEERVRKMAQDEGANSDDPTARQRAWTIARTAYRNERIAFAVQLLAFARAMQVPAAILARDAYVVKGRVAFSTSFLIARVNSSPAVRSPIDWTITGSGPSLSVTAYATDAGGVVREVTITMEQARAWGWGNTAPWKADPALMLRYRTAAQLIRLYFSASIFGLGSGPTAEELRDMRDVIDGTSEPVAATPYRPPALPEPVFMPEPEPVEVVAASK